MPIFWDQTWSIGAWERLDTCVILCLGIQSVERTSVQDIIRLSFDSLRRNPMAEPKPAEIDVSRERLAELLNEDLAREYQAIIAYVI